jgi:glycosyltransferase involved in cell wall biosynthesis
MKFCMVTTFYPPYHLGGDATFVRNLATELGRRGHDVDVVHDIDAFHVLRPGVHPAPIAAPPGVTVHPLASPVGRLSPLVTHQTGRPLLKPRLRRLLTEGRHDVIHFHNASLVGPGAFSIGRAVKLYTMHEQWLLCPLSLLWKFNRETCERPACVRCCLLAGRPPQLWRATGYLPRQLAHIDRFLAPSAFARDTHRRRGLDLPVTVLPNFVTDVRPPVNLAPPHRRPYFLFVGRLVWAKGLHTLLHVWRSVPDADLIVAGDGNQGAAWRRMAADQPNVVFLGAVDNEALRPLYRHALATIVPSVAYEVFPTVVLESFREATPVIGRNLGGIAEMVREAGGGLLYDTDGELGDAVARLSRSPELRRELGRRGRGNFDARWTADAHMTAYLGIIEECVRQRAGHAGGA